MGMLAVGVVVLAIYCALTSQITHAQTEEEINGMLEKLFTSDAEYPMHIRALRQNLLNRLYDEMEREQLENELLAYKHSINSLARQGAIHGKRNLAALAKGGYIRTIPAGDSGDEEQQEEEQDKRSLEALVHNSPSNAAAEVKRGIEALARNGELHGKRNLGSFVRSYNLPPVYRKRNVAALLRQAKLHAPNERAFLQLMEEQVQPPKHTADDKRNVGAAKANGYKPPTYKRSLRLPFLSEPKRNEADDYYSTAEYVMPVYQNQDDRDYEEMVKAFTGEYPPEKRFLGRLPQMGKSKTTPSPKISYK